MLTLTRCSTWWIIWCGQTSVDSNSNLTLLKTTVLGFTPVAIVISGQSILLTKILWLCQVTKFCNNSTNLPMSSKARTGKRNPCSPSTTEAQSFLSLLSTALTQRLCILSWKLSISSRWKKPLLEVLFLLNFSSLKEKIAFAFCIKKMQNNKKFF